MHKADKRMAPVVLEFAPLMLQRAFEPLQSVAVVAHITLPAAAVREELRKRGMSRVSLLCPKN